METMYNLLERIYNQEYNRLILGYPYSDNLELMSDIINAIDLIRCGNLTKDEIIKIIQYYEQF